MGTVPALHTWINGEIPNFRDMQSYVEDPFSFLMNPPMVRLRKTTSQNVTTNVTTTITWDFVEVETVDFWDATQPTRVKPSVPGWYIGQVGFAFSANASGLREMSVNKNASATERVFRIDHKPPTSGTATVANRGNVFLEYFNGTTDYMEVTLFQNSGTTLTILSDILERQSDIVLRWFAAT